MPLPTIASRYDTSEEIAEMAAFVAVLRTCGAPASDAVEELFYDGKMNECRITLAGTPPDTVIDQIGQIAALTLSHYALLETSYEGMPGRRRRQAQEQEQADRLQHEAEIAAENAEEEGDYSSAEWIEKEMMEDKATRRKGVAHPPVTPPSPDIVAKGKRGEDALNDWFQTHGIGYIAVCQAVKTFAPLFASGVKRPDFIMLVDGVGLLAIDAKNRSAYDGGFTIELSKELKKAVAFERLFRLPLWYAFCDVDAGMEEWYWISSLKVVETGETRKSKTGVDFLFIKFAHFEKIKVGADMAKLYTHRFASYKKVSAYPD